MRNALDSQSIEELNNDSEFSLHNSGLDEFEISGLLFINLYARRLFPLISKNKILKSEAIFQHSNPPILGLHAKEQVIIIPWDQGDVVFNKLPRVQLSRRMLEKV